MNAKQIEDYRDEIRRKAEQIEDCKDEIRRKIDYLDDLYLHIRDLLNKQIESVNFMYYEEIKNKKRRRLNENKKQKLED